MKTADKVCFVELAVRRRRSVAEPLAPGGAAGRGSVAHPGQLHPAPSRLAGGPSRSGDEPSSGPAAPSRSSPAPSAVPSDLSAGSTPLSADVASLSSDASDRSSAAQSLSRLAAKLSRSPANPSGALGRGHDLPESCHDLGPARQAQPGGGTIGGKTVTIWRARSGRGTRRSAGARLAGPPEGGTTSFAASPHLRCAHFTPFCPFCDAVDPENHLNRTS